MDQVHRTNTRQAVDVEDVLLSFGSFNRFQLCVFFLAGMGDLFSAWHNLVPAFFNAPSDEVKCCLPQGVELTNDSIPLEEGKGDVWGWSECEVYANYSAEVSGGNATIPCPVGYNYTDNFVQTVITEFDLVCGNLYLADTASSLFIVGAIAGILLWPLVGDNYGRRVTILASYIGACITGSTLVIVTSIYGFMVVRFLTGMILSGCGCCSFVLAMEWFTMKQRTFFGQAYWVFWIVGYCSLPLLAYYIRDWRHLQITISVPFIVSFAMILVLPESAHWYVSKNRQDSAKALLQRAAEVNGTHLPEYTLLEGNKTEEKLEQKKTFWDVIKHGYLRRYTITMSYVLFCNSLVYYALSLGATNWTGNMYLNFFYAGIIEVPAYVFGYYTLKRWGRPKPISSFNIIAGLPLILQIFIPTSMSSGADIGWIKTVLNVIAKFGITASYASMWLFLNEIYPTIVRNAGFGIQIMSARLGGIIAPYGANTLALLAPEAVFITFGILSVIAGLMCLLLPDTLNTPLLETLEDLKLLTDPMSQVLESIKDHICCTPNQNIKNKPEENTAQG